MSHDFTIVALVGVALGTRHVLRYLGQRKTRQSDPIQTWESEGGAVPVAPNRTAAQTNTAYQWPQTAP
jgi:hypothetical protein